MKKLGNLAPLAFSPKPNSTNSHYFLLEGSMMCSCKIQTTFSENAQISLIVHGQSFPLQSEHLSCILEMLPPTNLGVCRLRSELVRSPKAKSRLSVAELTTLSDEEVLLLANDISSEVRKTLFSNPRFYDVLSSQDIVERFGDNPSLSDCLPFRHLSKSSTVRINQVATLLSEHRDAAVRRNITTFWENQRRALTQQGLRKKKNYGDKPMAQDVCLLIGDYCCPLTQSAFHELISNLTEDDQFDPALFSLLANYPDADIRAAVAEYEALDTKTCIQLAHDRADCVCDQLLLNDHALEQLPQEDLLFLIGQDPERIHLVLWQLDNRPDRDDIFTHYSSHTDPSVREEINEILVDKKRKRRPLFFR